jgi:hypothetical protein
MNGYELSRNWFDWCFENPEKINPNHSALYFFCIEHCNRLGWKEKFGLPTTMVMEAIGIKSYNTYIKTFNDLICFGFIDLIEKSRNQHSSNIIALSKNNKALDKALDKATVKHATKQSESTEQSKCSIDKPITNNQEQETKEKELSFDERVNKFLSWFNSQKEVNGFRKGNFSVLSKATESNFKKILKTNYSSEQLNNAFKNMCNNTWVRENNKITPDHFLRIDNLEKYINQEDVVSNKSEDTRVNHIKDLIEKYGTVK